MQLKTFTEKYATQILTMLPTHQIRELLPNSFSEAEKNERDHHSKLTVMVRGLVIVIVLITG